MDSSSSLTRTGLFKCRFRSLSGGVSWRFSLGFSNAVKDGMSRGDGHLPPSGAKAGNFSPRWWFSFGCSIAFRIPDREGERIRTEARSYRSAFLSKRILIYALSTARTQDGPVNRSRWASPHWHPGARALRPRPISSSRIPRSQPVPSRGAPDARSPQGRAWRARRQRRPRTQVGGAALGAPRRARPLRPPPGAPPPRGAGAGPRALGAGAPRRRARRSGAEQRRSGPRGARPADGEAAPSTASPDSPCAPTERIRAPRAGPR